MRGRSKAGSVKNRDAASPQRQSAPGGAEAARPRSSSAPELSIWTYGSSSRFLTCATLIQACPSVESPGQNRSFSYPMSQRTTDIEIAIVGSSP